MGGGARGEAGHQLAGDTEPVGAHGVSGWSDRHGPPPATGDTPDSSPANDARRRADCQDQKMNLPPPGPLPTVGSMKGYGQFCPIAIAAEIFAERWTPLILRELLAGSRRFNDIRHGVPLISRSLLAQR